MTDQFAGIYEKLQRAEEHIGNLNVEITGFIESSDYPVIPNDNDEMFHKAMAYHDSRPIPPRFSIIAGEVIHHLRSCLDHIAWLMSSSEERRDHPKRIEFPVFDRRPTTKEEKASYKRKVKGIADPKVLAIIEGLQPYNSTTPQQTQLWLIHDMDITDKHRELVICHSVGNLHIPIHLINEYIANASATVTEEFVRKFQQDIKITSQIAFKDIGGRKYQFVVPALMASPEKSEALSGCSRTNWGKVAVAFICKGEEILMPFASLFVFACNKCNWPLSISVATPTKESKQSLSGSQFKLKCPRDGFEGIFLAADAIVFQQVEWNLKIDFQRDK